MWSSPASKPLETKVLIEALLQKREDASIKLLDLSYEDEFADTIADAFAEDPMLHWMTQIPDSNQNKEQSLIAAMRWFTLGMNRHLLKQRKGAVFGIMDGTKMAGAMALIPSSQQSPGIFAGVMHMIFHGGSPPWDATKEDYGEWTSKRLESMDVLTKKRNEYKKSYPRFIYLQQVGVRRDFRGKKLGGKLFRTLFAAADSLRVPVYLETESEENEAMYQHFGFQTVETVMMAAKGDTSTDAQFKMYLMARPPREV